MSHIGNCLNNTVYEKLCKRTLDICLEVDEKEAEVTCRLCWDWSLDLKSNNNHILLEEYEKHIGTCRGAPAPRPGLNNDVPRRPGLDIRHEEGAAGHQRPPQGSGELGQRRLDDSTSAHIVTHLDLGNNNPVESSVQELDEHIRTCRGAPAPRPGLNNDVPRGPGLDIRHEEGATGHQPPPQGSGGLGQKRLDDSTSAHIVTHLDLGNNNPVESSVQHDQISSPNLTCHLCHVWCHSMNNSTSDIVLQELDEHIRTCRGAPAPRPGLNNDVPRGPGLDLRHEDGTDSPQPPPQDSGGLGQRRRLGDSTSDHIVTDEALRSYNSVESSVQAANYTELDLRSDSLASGETNS